MTVAVEGRSPADVATARVGVDGLLGCVAAASRSSSDSSDENSPVIARSSASARSPVQQRIPYR
jgi:hypothetical protein